MASPFKAYDVRGVIPAEMNVPFAYRFGQATAVRLSCRSAVVGHYMRRDSPAFAAAIAQGLLDMGVDVRPVGQCGTEEVYFHTADTGADVGLMVTASHNPESYNGIKMVLKGATAATRENALDGIEELVFSDTPIPAVRRFEERGRSGDLLPRAAYVERLLRQVEGFNLKPVKIVCHAGNGCAGAVIDALEPHLPFTFVKIDHEADPSLPNGIPNPLLPEKRARAAEAVVASGADLAIAWDGDFDRCFFYDHQGRFIEGYYIVGLIAQMALRKEPGATILYDPRLTWNTIDVVTAAGGTAKPCAVGHAFFKQKMRAENAVYGGEMSAHHYFRDFSYCDTGMLSWLSVVAELSASGLSLAEMVEQRIAAFPCSGEINFTVADAPAIRGRVADHFAAADPAVDELDGLSMAFDDWRFNLRSSNTEPLLRLNVETRGDARLLDRKVAELSDLIRRG
ncbi:MAG: phosphomannomutase [Pararhizobium sp.]